MLTDTTAEPAKEKSKNGQNPAADDPRRRYPLEFKLKVLREAMAPGASVAAVARRNDMNTNVVFRWRKLFREGRLGEEATSGAKQLPAPALVPVRIVPDAPPQTAKPAARQAARTVSPAKTGTIHLTLPGGIALRVDADIDDAALRRVLRAVKDLS